MIDYWLLFTMNIMVYTLAFHTFLQVHIYVALVISKVFFSLKKSMYTLISKCDCHQKRVKDEAAEGGFQESGDILKQRHGRIGK